MLQGALGQGHQLLFAWFLHLQLLPLGPHPALFSAHSSHIPTRCVQWVLALSLSSLSLHLPRQLPPQPHSTPTAITVHQATCLHIHPCKTLLSAAPMRHHVPTRKGNLAPGWNVMCLPTAPPSLLSCPQRPSPPGPCAQGCPLPRSTSPVDTEGEHTWPEGRVPTACARRTCRWAGRCLQEALRSARALSAPGLKSTPSGAPRL